MIQVYKIIHITLCDRTENECIDMEMVYGRMNNLNVRITSDDVSRSFDIRIASELINCQYVVFPYYYYCYCYYYY